MLTPPAMTCMPTFDPEGSWIRGGRERRVGLASRGARPSYFGGVRLTLTMKPPGTGTGASA